MSRTGKFGRPVRAAPSLTNTLVAIAREFQQQRDQNLMDAWMKGGTWEGQKATDELVLKHWQERVNGVSKDDPLHDTYANAHTQLDYTIHESKMTAAYAQHKASDAQMVGFYLNWAKKVPKDSEFYRVLQRDAGQYMRKAKVTSQADIHAAKEAAYDKAQATTRKGKEAAGEFVIDTLRRVAQSGYADGGIAALISAPGSNSDLTDFDPSDPEQMLKLLNVITPTHDTSPREGKRTSETVGNTDAIFHNDDGKAVTGQDIINTLAKLDPSHKPGEPFDVTYVTGLLDRQINGLNERIERANKTGHLSDATNLEKSKGYIATLNREVGSWPVQKAYTDLRETFDAVKNDPTASPGAVLKAWQTYQGSLYKLSEDPRIAADDNLRSRIVGEANGDSVPTLSESFSGLAGGAFDPASAKDSANTKAQVEFLQGQVDAVANKQAVWTYGKTDSNGVFVPQAGGTEIGAGVPEAIQAGGANMQQITVADPRGGLPLQMMVTATPVFATATDPSTGLDLQSSNKNPVAYAYDVPKGGRTETVYGFQTKTGFVFSSDPPWDENLKTVSSNSGGNHIEVDMTPVVERLMGGRDQMTGGYGQLDKSKDADLGNGFFVRGSAPAGPRGGAAKMGELVFDPLAAVTSTSSRNALGANDPLTDFHSLTLANLMADSEGRATLNNLDKNPAFQNQLDNDAYASSGFQRDLKTGQWVPGQNANQDALNTALQQNHMAAMTTSMFAFIDEASKTYQRLTTGSPFTGGQSATQPGQSGGATPMENVTKLATDVLQASMNPFQALANVFQPGTSSLKQANFAGKNADDLAIKTAGTIKVPGLAAPVAPAPIVTQGPTAGPTSVYTPPPSQTSSQPPSQTGHPTGGAGGGLYNRPS